MSFINPLFPSFLFIAWSLLLRTIATFLIKDCTEKPINSSLPHAFFSIVDFFVIILWIFAAYKLTDYIPAYVLFLSALCVTVYTDVSAMLISRFVSLYLVPVGIFLAYVNLLSITVYESIVATIFGYVFFWIINKIFYLIKGHDGLGQGDLELIAMIGSFIGILGTWYTILLASVTGTIFGCCTMLWTRKAVPILPFGPFLAFAACSFVLFQSEILNFLVKNIL